MVKRPGIGFFGKVRIPTIGHLSAINAAKDIAGKTGAQLHIGLTGAASPLTSKMKHQHAEALFGHPVMPEGKHTNNIIDFLSHMSKKHPEDFTLVAGSDRSHEYKSLMQKYNGKRDQNGNPTFKFKKWRVHEVPGERKEINKDPTKMNKNELVQSVSASKLEKIAKDGNYNHFKAYHPGLPDLHVKRVYNQIRAGLALKEELQVPNIGMTFSRKLMPQLGKSEKGFLSYLQKNDIDYSKKHIATKDLKSTQSEFDDDKIISMMFSDKDTKCIIVSNDNYVLDGHHRWLADHNSGEKTTEAYVIDAPILELMRIAKEYQNSLNEGITRKDFGPMLASFVSFASDRLGIKSLPNIEYQDGAEGQSSFGAYNPTEKTIKVVTKNRQILDVMRTLSHELIHHKQNEDGRIIDIAKEGSTGSEIENEANAKAGIIMRHWGKKNPDHFKLPGLVENAAIFVVGGPCSGKDKIIKTLKEHLKIDELDIQTVGKVDHIPRQIIVNGSADRLDEITRTNDLLKHNGYKTSLIFVDVDNEISKFRNEARKLRGQRMLKESVRFAKYETAKNNKQTLEKLFGEQMTAVDNSKNDKPSKREWGTKSLTKNYTVKTPGQTNRKIEDISINPYENLTGGGYGLTTGLAGPPGPGGLAEVRLSVRLWAENPKTIERFAKKYGDLAEKKLMEAAAALNIADKARNLGPKPFGKIRESFDKGLLDSPIFGRKEDDLGEDGPIKRKRFAKKRKQINILPPQPKG